MGLWGLKYSENCFQPDGPLSPMVLEHWGRWFSWERDNDHRSVSSALVLCSNVVEPEAHILSRDGTVGSREL